MNKRFRVLTSGESHGKCLNAIIEGVPSNISISTDEINRNLARRQKGYGRGGRMKIETDTVEIKSGIRHGKTTGAPICLEIKNKDYENWQTVMCPEKIEQTDEILAQIESKSFTKLRPGHADYAGSIKYNAKDLRNILERSSARKTAIEVAVGSIAQQVLKNFGIEGTSTVKRIGSVENTKKLPDFETVKQFSENSEVRCWDEETSQQMKSEIDNAQSQGTTLGGEIEIYYKNLPVGLGSFVSYDRAIDGLIAQAVMSIPAIKSVEFGMGKDVTKNYGKDVHDPFIIENEKIKRISNNAGGVEGGMTNGEMLIVRAGMKPIPTMRTPLPTVDIKNMAPAEAHFERSDTCAVPACAIVAEMRVATVLLDEFLIKFGGDSLEEILSHYGKSYE